MEETDRLHLCRYCEDIIDCSDGTYRCSQLKEETTLNSSCGYFVEAEKPKIKLNPINNFILDKSRIPQKIDHALGFIEINKKKFRYYGIMVNEKIVKEKNGEQHEIIKETPAIVLEDGSIISKNSKPNNCDFDFLSMMGLNNTRWSLESIHKFTSDDLFDGDYSFKKVHNSFKSFYTNSMVYEDKEWYDLDPIWDQCTYFQDLIDKAPIIKHEGPSGSAKSKGMKLSSNLAFNGKKFLKPTPATFFRYRNNNKSMLCIEEAEKLFDTGKLNSDDNLLVEYLNGSYEKGNTVPRQNDKNINKTDEFDPFGFTRIGSIKPLKGALEKRSLTHYMVIASDKDNRGNIEISSGIGEEYQKSRDLAYINGLFHYRQYVNALKNVKNIYNLSNRQWLVAKPLIAMAGCIDKELETKIGNFISRIFEIRDSEIDEQSWNVILANVLVELFCKYKEPTFISSSELKDRLSEKINLDREKIAKVSTNKTTRLMKELSLGSFASRNTIGTERGFLLTFYKIIEILLRNKVFSIEDILKKVSEVSECQYSVDEIGKWYTDTLTDTSKNNKKESVISDTLTDLTLFRGVTISKNEEIVE